MSQPRLADRVHDWVHGHPDGSAVDVGFADTPQGTTARGSFLGQNTSDPAARGELIFTDPQNLPTAVAILLTHAQNRADFHPVSANPASLLDGFLRYLAEIRSCPAFTETLNDQRQEFFDSSDYNVLVNQIAQTYVGVSHKDQLLLAQSMANMYRSVMSSDHAELWFNLFTQTTIDYSRPDDTRIYLYFTTLHMRHEVQHSGKTETVLSEQTYFVRRAIYRVLPDVIGSNAKTFAALVYVNVDTWLNMATSPERADALPLCFEVRLLDRQRPAKAP
jgi:hypothetical protein